MDFQIITNDWRGLKDYKQAILATSILSCQIITNDWRGSNDYKQAILATSIMAF